MTHSYEVVVILRKKLKRLGEEVQLLQTLTSGQLDPMLNKQQIAEVDNSSEELDFLFHTLGTSFDFF